MGKASNEYKNTEEDKAAKKERKSERRSKNKQTKKKKLDIFRPVKDLFSEKNRKLNLTLGAFFILFSVYLLLSFISYIFTWQLDQNLIINQGFFEFVFNTEEIELQNHLGKFGAWISHRFMYEWFGLSSFLFPLILIVLGVFLLIRKKILPIGKVISKSIIGIVVISLFLGYFTGDESFPYGGAFGYHFNNWLKMAVGSFGAFMFECVILFIAVVQLFNPDFKSIAARLGLIKRQEEEEVLATDGDLDIIAVNTIDDNDITQDDISETVEFEKDEDNEAEVVVNIEKNEEDVVSPEDDFEVEVVKEEVQLDDGDLNDKLKEFGEYDPKLDLSAYKLPTIDLLETYGDGKVSMNKGELEDNKNRIVEVLGH